MLHYPNLRQLMFRLDPETAHNLVEYACAFAPKIPALLPFISKRLCFNDPVLTQTIDGMLFYNPVGLAAGFDKNATMIESLCSLGFSHLELGAITPLAQRGNEKPRLWRHTLEESLQNAMGFNNDGANAVSARLDRCYPFVLPLGLNIGKNKLTAQGDAIKDYIALARIFAENTDYLSINVSSPNTPNLRDLQNTTFLKELFAALREIYAKPLYLKISPDLAIDVALSLTQCAINSGANGIIATNTTLDYSLVANPKEQGGISGKALATKSRETLKQIAKYLKTETHKMTLISVGGIGDAKEAYRRIKLGANLIQLFSAMIFKGPSLIYTINKNLKELLERDGFNHISEAVGVDL